VKETVKKLLVAVDKRIQFMRECKNHMKVGRINNFRPAFIYPQFLLDSLTIGTVTVTAGIVMKLRVPTVLTLGNIYS
jgi:hypothetical protein